MYAALDPISNLVCRCMSVCTLSLGSSSTHYFDNSLLRYRLIEAQVFGDSPISDMYIIYVCTCTDSIQVQLGCY